MRSSAPNLMVAGWAGSFGVDNDEAGGGVATSGTAPNDKHYSNKNAWLLRDVRNLGDRYIPTVAQAAVTMSDEKPVYVFEAGVRLNRRPNFGFATFSGTADGWAPSWYGVSDLRALDAFGCPSFGFYAVNAEGLGVVRQASLATTAGGVVDAAVDGGRLLDILPAVDKVPVSWIIQPNEKVFCVARLGVSDGGGRTFLYCADVYAVGEVQP